ncbi:hypothetical protein FACS189450_11000 [Spirochaetia bacterium]|nr:hypothetical protein FACS189450_11000 [Spirochaetia bacterium]
MAIIKSTAKAGRIGLKSAIPKEVIQEVRRVARESRKHPDEYDPDCPPSTPEALAEFAALAREIRKRKPSPVVSIRLKPETLEKYKALGKGYTGTMGDVLNYVADNPEILAKVL